MGFEIENGVLKKYREEPGVTEVVIPDWVTSIGDWAFSACKKLTAVTIPNSVSSIGDWAFSLCSKLTTVNIPDSVTSIIHPGAKNNKIKRFEFFGCKSGAFWVHRLIVGWVQRLQS